MVFLHDLWLAFKTNYKLLLLASLPALALTAFGLNQLEAPAAAWAAALPVRLLIEFVFLGAGLALLVLLGVKNKWLPALLLYVYYLACTADFVLLWYFKERFGAKYLDTLQGGDYAFLTDWRTLSYPFVSACIFDFLLFYRTPLLYPPRAQNRGQTAGSLRGGNAGVGIAQSPVPAAQTV